MDLVWRWLTAAAQWQGPDGVPARVLEHLVYSGVALALAAVVAVPAGLWVGHTGRGQVAVVGTAGTLRAIPSLGLLFVAVLALLVDGVVAVLQRLVVSRGLTAREQRRPRSVTSAATLDKDVAARPTSV